MTNNNDSRFFTNTENNSLLERFKQTLKHVGKFDVLVGYFRSSGFFSLYKDLENIDEIRILNGLDIDEKTFDIIEESKNEMIESGQKTKENFAKSFETEVANANDTKEVYEGLMKFKEFVKSGKIRFKQHPSHNIHAKVYISRFKGELSEMGNCNKS